MHKQLKKKIQKDFHVLMHRFVSNDTLFLILTKAYTKIFAKRYLLKIVNAICVVKSIVIQMDGQGY